LWQISESLQLSKEQCDLFIGDVASRKNTLLCKGIARARMKINPCFYNREQALPLSEDLWDQQ